jgi:hypothetical protein
MMAHARWSQEAEPLGMISGLARKLKAGSLAPTFTLPTIADHGVVSLSSLQGKPVVLVFGSLSCDSFCDRIGDIERMYQAYKDRAAFLFVYVTEAGHRIRGLEFVIGSAGLDTPEGRRADWRGPTSNRDDTARRPGHRRVRRDRLRRLS